jgi:SAM-dependent methyltransferase
MKNQKKLEQIDIFSLICPQCNVNEFIQDEICLKCEKCGIKYKKENDKLFFTKDYFDVDKWENKSKGFDLFKRKKYNFRKIDNISGPRIRDLKSYLNVDGLALNLGGGSDNYDGFINVDLGRYPNVHVVCSLEKIPFKSSSVDLVVSNSVLEHIKDYKAVINEIYRILKPGGYLYLSVPNLCMRHHKYDFHRWTIPGLLDMLKNFDAVESGSCRGVAYALETLVEALIVYKTKPGIFREILRRSWLFFSRPLYWIKADGSEEYDAMSQTIYAIVKKN